MKKLIFIIVFIPLISFCQSEMKSQYPKNVGDIAFDKNTDKENFYLCNSNYIYQYFNNGGGLEFEGEKLAIEKEFEQKYKSEIKENENGLIRIQFVVNCKGETDRFRLIAMDNDYNEKTFDKLITNQLLSITKNLKGWKPKKIREKEIDYYQYLSFKIEKGQLIEILP